MIDNLIAFSIRNKLLVGIFTLALIIWGGISLTQIPIDAVPDITNNQVQLITKAPSFSAQEIEQFITAPLELVLANLQDVEEIRSISRFGISVITVVFKDEMNIYLARQLVGEQIKNVDIPAEMGVPEMTPITTGLGEIYQYVIHPQKGFEKKYSATDLRTIQDWIVRRQLAGTPGVVEVNSFGGYVKQYEVAVNPEKLRAANLTILEVLQALENNNENTGGSYIEKNASAYFIRGEGMVNQLADIEQIVVKNVHNLPVLIKDIAQVQFGSAMRYGAMTRNGKGEVVGGIVMMLKGANSAQVIANVKTRIVEVQKTLPEGLIIEAFLDRTDLVNRAIHTVTTNLIEGGLIVILVLVVFLGNLRAGLVVASVIPLAMLFAISMMNLFGVSANLMSLGAIDFGLVVDGAVIIVEAILHRLHLHPPTELELNSHPAKGGLGGINRVVYDASVQIRKSAAFGEIIILMVYLPILALVGVEGKMFRPMAQTVGFAILGALILSLTYVPMMSALVLKHKISTKKNFSDYLMEFIQRQYNPVIRFALRKKAIVLGTALSLFLGSLLIFNTLGGEFIPQLDEGDFAVETRLMTGSSLSQTIETSTQAEKILLKFPEVKQVISKIGTSEIPTDPMPLEANDLMVILKDKSEWTTAHDKEELANKMREALSVLPGINFEFQQPIEMRFNELMTGIKSDVAVKIYGEDLNTLFTKANECAKHIRKIVGVGDLKVEQIVGLPQMLVKYDRRKIAQYGLNIKDLNNTLQTAFAGKVAGFVFEGEKRFAMAVRFDYQNRQDIENLKGIYINLPQGKQIPMEELAQIEYVNAPVQISRDDAKRRITIGLNVSGRDVESLVNEIKSTLAQKVKLPAGYYFKFGGQFENLEKAKARLTIAVPMALVLIFSLLYFTFNSFKQSILIFTAIPLSAIGGVLALWLRGMPFSISAGVGFIALFGVAVLNGIVLIGYFNQLEKEGVNNLYRRVLLGTQVRLRPVVMTATVASLGFLPMAISHGAGAEVQKPLATVVIGGLITATMLTLVVLPVLYILFSQKKSMARRRRLNYWFKKTKKSSINFFILFIISFLPISTFAQNLTLEEVIQQALQNNRALKMGTYEIELSKTLQKSAFEVGKTNFMWMGGQYNSIRFDNNFTISQSLPLPNVWNRQRELYKAQTQNNELKYQITKNELIHQVKMAYYNACYFQARQKLLQKLDSIYSDFVKASNLRLKTGEGTLLEQTTAESQALEIKLQLTQNQANIAIYESQLQTLIHSNQKIQLIDNQLVRRELALAQDTTQISQNPLLAQLKQQILVNEKSVALEKSRLLPDLSLGYFNQSLIGTQNLNGQDRFFGGNYRFQGFQVGLALPIWAKAQKARVQAIQIQGKIAETQVELAQKTLQGEFEQATLTYLKSKAGLEYYEQSALKNADLILTQAHKAFQSGEIGYLEYSQALNRVLAIQDNYLNLLNAHNQAIIYLEFLIGKE